MILVAVYGLHFAKEGDHWRCVEHPSLVMLRGVCLRVGDLICGLLDEVLRLAAADAPRASDAAAKRR